MEWPELEYDDIVDAIAAGSRQGGPPWTRAATRLFGRALERMDQLPGDSRFVWSALTQEDFRQTGAHLRPLAAHSNRSSGPLRAVISSIGIAFVEGCCDKAR